MTDPVRVFSLHQTSCKSITPSQLCLTFSYRLDVFWAGLVQKKCAVGGYQWSWWERGVPDKKKSSLVIVHGFSMRGAAYAELCKVSG